MWKLRLQQILTPVLAVALQLVLGSVVLASAAATDGHDAHAEGSLKSDLAFWGVVAFIGFVVAIKFLGWDGLVSGMKSREQNERKLIADAQQLHASAAAELKRQKGQLESFDEQVREMLAEAERDTVSTRTEITSLAQREAKVLHQRAEVEIGRVRDQSLSELFDTMATRVADRTEQRIRDQFGPADQEKLLEFALSEFATRQA
ncbi:MAG: ATP synthase F0 subunit B [Planctomycetaceae bacterium]